MDAADAGVRSSSFVLLAVAMLAIGLDVGIAEVSWAGPMIVADLRRLPPASRTSNSSM